MKPRTSVSSTYREPQVLGTGMTMTASTLARLEALQLEHTQLQEQHQQLQEDFEVEATACKSATASLRQKEKECAALEKDKKVGCPPAMIAARFVVHTHPSLHSVLCKTQWRLPRSCGHSRTRSRAPEQARAVARVPVAPTGPRRRAVGGVREDARTHCFCSTALPFVHARYHSATTHAWCGATR